MSNSKNLTAKPMKYEITLHIHTQSHYTTLVEAETPHDLAKEIKTIIGAASEITPEGAVLLDKQICLANWAPA